MLRYDVHNLIIVTLCILHYAVSKHLPRNWPRCTMGDPKESECVRSSIEEVMKKLGKGSPEMSIPSLEPMYIPSLNIIGNGLVHVEQHFIDIRLHGITGTIIESANIDLHKYVLRATSLTPKLLLEGVYNMNGRILLMPIQGEGNCTVILQNIAINHTLIGEVFQYKDRQFMEISEYIVNMRPEKVHFQFDNLYMGEVFNKLLNENSDTFFRDVQGGYEHSFGMMFKNLANKVFTKVPLDNIFHY